MKEPLADIFPASARQADAGAWQELERAGRGSRSAAAAWALLQRAAATGAIPPWTGELAALELARRRLSRRTSFPPTEQLAINPRLQLIPVSWQGLPALLEPGNDTPPSPGNGYVLVWRHPIWQNILTEEATPADLLALKLMADGLDADGAAAAGGVTPAIIEGHLRQGVQRGLLVSPPPAIRRQRSEFDPAGTFDDEALVAPVFTLQWHITQRCDLHCRHCYDRSDRRDVGFEEGLRILDQLRSFCLAKHVQGQVSFSGGNPFLHPRFADLYRAAVERGFVTAILGNPVARGELNEIIAIRRPAYFQVSLEGLREHNDEIRGAGHFDRTLAFLRVLRQRQVSSLVMLTLTRSNMDQVIPLGRELTGLTDGLAFNRLALVGEGARLQLPEPDAYRRFLDQYVEAVSDVPVLALKDNLLNRAFHDRGDDLFCGCAGYGCGAAFNFLSLLPDGELHACRKFPSPVGTLAEATLSEVYDSEAAERYRRGSSACSGCRLHAVCGGCLAVTRSMGLDPFTDRDPFCLQGAIS